MESIVYPWPYAWDGTEDEQLRLGASLSFRESLIWLEEATEFAQSLRKRYGSNIQAFPKILPPK
jgi:hypothetical protein